VTATVLRWACGCAGPTHDLGGHCIGAAPVVDEDDGCPVRNHRRDALCARTRLDALPALDQADGERGGAT
jgi:hypothetical protein